MFSTTIVFWEALDIRVRWLSTVLFPITIDQNQGNFLLCSGNVAPRYLSNYSFRQFICCITILSLMSTTGFLMSVEIYYSVSVTIQRLQYSRIKMPILYVFEICHHLSQIDKKQYPFINLVAAEKRKYYFLRSLYT